MQKSEEIAELIKGLAEFHKEVEQPKKDGDNPHFGSDYVTLDEIIRVVDKTAVQHGIIYTQEVITQDGTAGVTTTIWHTSGQYITFEPVILPTAKQTPQQYGSSITYARRYSLSAAFGLASEPDDDGNAGSQGKGGNQGGNNGGNSGNKGPSTNGQGKTQQRPQNSQQNKQPDKINISQKHTIEAQAKKFAKIRGGSAQQVYEHLGISDLEALSYQDAEDIKNKVIQMVEYVEKKQEAEKQQQQTDDQEKQEFDEVANGTSEETA